ncbi:MAG TPA: molecular chaperone DnaJ [bacterium]|nr:molecular chaperone DnaJ [bacterium]
MARRDLYEVLGVSRSATPEEIKRAFRHLARAHHPDVSQDPHASERFKEINEAYQVLGDPERRTLYDRTGQVGPTGRDGGGISPFGGTPFEDIFEMFFGRERSTGGEPGPERGSDLRVRLEVTVEEAAAGIEKQITIAREETCPVCFGTGAEKGGSAEPCPTCHGAGQVRYSRRTAFGSFAQVAPCPKCGGAGTIIRHPCLECRGSGRARAKREITVKIPAGVEDGTRLRLQGEGEAGMRGGERGDLYVDLTIAPHPVFTRQGRDLHCEVPVSITQAALGDQIEVPSLDGPTPLAIPPGLQTGSTTALRGKGMPSLRDGRGDLIVHFRVVIPQDLTKEQAQLLHQFSVLRGEDLKPPKKTLLGKFRTRHS